MARLEDEFAAETDLAAEFAAETDLAAEFAAEPSAESLAPTPLTQDGYKQWVTQRAQQGQKEPISKPEAAFYKFYDGFLKGGLDEGVGAAARLYGRGKSMLTGGDPGEADIWEDVGTRLTRERVRAATEQEPVISGLAGQAGDLLSDAAAGVITRGKSFTPAGQGALGALEGALRADASPGDRLMGGATSGALALIGGKVAGKLGPLGAPAFGAAVSEGLGALGGETDAEAAERRTRMATGLSAGAVGALRSRLGRHFGARKDKALGEVREKITEGTLEATDKTAAENAKKIAVADKDYEKGEAFRNKEVADRNAPLFKDADDEIALEGRKLEAQRQDSEKYYEELLRDELAGKKEGALSALHGHGEQPVDPEAAALGRLGAYVQEGYRFPRNEGDLKSRGFVLDEDAEAGLQAIIPDYTAKANEHLGRLGRLGKAGLLEEFRAEEMAKAAAKAEHDAKVAEARKMATNDLPPEVKHWAAERSGYDPARLKPDSPEDLVDPGFKAAVLEKYRGKAQPLPVKPEPRPVPDDLEYLPKAPGKTEDGSGLGMKPAIEAEVEAGGQRATEAAKARAKMGKMGFYLAGGLGTGLGYAGGGVPGAGAGAALALGGAGVGMYRGAADRAKIDPNTMRFKDAGAAAWWNQKLERVLGGNPDLRQKLTTFLTVDQMDPAALEYRLQWALDNVPGFREAWEADGAQ